MAYTFYPQYRLYWVIVNNCWAQNGDAEWKKKKVKSFLISVQQAGINQYTTSPGQREFAVLQREGAKFTEAPGKDWSQALCTCMLLTCSDACQPGEALALLRLTAHEQGFCRVTGPGDADVISEWITALRQKRKHHQPVWQSYRGHMFLQHSEELSSAVTWLSGAVKGHQ